MTLRRRQRLRGAGAFASIRTEGERRVCGCLVLNWKPTRGEHSRLAVITSRKLGGAVVRSRARRLLREAFRLQQHDLRGTADLVLIARASLVGKSLEHVRRDLRRCLREAGLINKSAGPS